VSAKRADKVLVDSGGLDGIDGFSRRLPEVGDVFPRRINADGERVERGLAQLVLTLVELLRQLLERQALRRVEGGTLSDGEIERLGEALMRLETRMAELKREFELGDDDLNLDLGPLGRLL
jgi:Gas vesicle protein K